MKEIKSRKKSGFFKKVFVKICRILGYELIDQSSLEFPVSNKKSDDTLSVPGVKSFSLGLGEFPITRKVQGIDIIVKTCTSVQLVTQNKKRIFEKEKSEYTFRSLQSLCKSALDLKRKFPKIFIQFTIIDIGSEENSKNKLISFVKDFPSKFIDLDKKKIEVDTEKFETNQKGIYAVGDICTYPGKLKLILSGFHEGALAARACFKLARPNEKYRFEFTTSSKTIKNRLGVKGD